MVCARHQSSNSLFSLRNTRLKRTTHTKNAIQCIDHFLKFVRRTSLGKELPQTSVSHIKDRQFDWLVSLLLSFKRFISSRKRYKDIRKARERGGGGHHSIHEKCVDHVFLPSTRFQSNDKFFKNQYFSIQHEWDGERDLGRYLFRPNLFKRKREEMYQKRKRDSHGNWSVFYYEKIIMYWCHEANNRGKEDLLSFKCLLNGLTVRWLLVDSFSKVYLYLFLLIYVSWETNTNFEQKITSTSEWKGIMEEEQESHLGSSAKKVNRIKHDLWTCLSLKKERLNDGHHSRYLYTEWESSLSLVINSDPKLSSHHDLMIMGRRPLTGKEGRVKTPSWSSSGCEKNIQEWVRCVMSWTKVVES